MTLLRVSGLRVETEGLPVLRGVDFEVSAGERVGLIGESGSGKTVAALTLMGLQPEGFAVQGSVEFEGVSWSGSRTASSRPSGAPGWRWSSRSR